MAERAVIKPDGSPPPSITHYGERTLKKPSDNNGLHAKAAAPILIDSVPAELWLLLADLHGALMYLEKRENPSYAATFPMIHRHAWCTYDEIIGVLPGLTISDEKRQLLAARLAVLETRLTQLGDNPSS